MPHITVSESTHTAVTEFKQVVETVIGEEIAVDDCVALILSEGINSMLKDLLGSSDPATLLASLQQLGSKHPAQVYGFIAETLKTGVAVQERERLRHKLGFSREQT